jgi:hypothetical protein
MIGNSLFSLRDSLGGRFIFQAIAALRAQLLFLGFSVIAGMTKLCDVLMAILL